MNISTYSSSLLSELKEHDLLFNEKVLVIYSSNSALYTVNAGPLFAHRHWASNLRCPLEKRNKDVISKSLSREVRIFLFCFTSHMAQLL